MKSMKNFFSVCILLCFLGCLGKQSKSERGSEVIAEKENNISEEFNNDYYLPLTPDYIFALINFVIEVSLENFNNSDYQIYPTFYTGLLPETIENTIKCNDNIFTFSDSELKQFIRDYSIIKGDSIKYFLSSEENQKRISNEIRENGVLIMLSPPMVGRNKNIIYFYVNAVFPYLDGISSDKVIYGFRIITDSEEAEKGHGYPNLNVDEMGVELISSFNPVKECDK